MPRILDLDEAKKNPDWDVVFKFGPRVNAGDAAAILWESPYEGAYGLWLLKTGRKPRPEQTAAMAHGNITEPLIFDWYQQHKGITGVSQAWALSDDEEWIQAKADFWNAETKALAEFKAPSREDSADHLLAKTGVIPEHYRLQCIHMMEVFDTDEMDFVSWRSPDDFALIKVPRDQDYWMLVMLPAYMEFWQRVQENAWPRPTGDAIEESEEWRMHARRYLDSKAMVGEATNLRKRAEAHIKRMAIAKRTTGGGIKATWTEYRPRWEAKVTATSEAALQAIMKALAPLEGKQGVGKITSTAWPPNLVLRVSEQGESDE